MKIELSNSQIKELIERNILTSNQLKDIVLNLLTEKHGEKSIETVKNTVETANNIIENLTEKPVKRYRRYTPEFIAGIQKRVDQGEMLSTICKEMHVCYTSVFDRINRPVRTDKKKVR